MSIPMEQFWLQRAGQLKRRAMSALERLAALSANVVEFARTPTGKSPVATTPQMEETNSETLEIYKIRKNQKIQKIRKIQKI